MPEPEEINTAHKAVELGVKAEIAARLKLRTEAQTMKKSEKPKGTKAKWSKN